MKPMNIAQSDMYFLTATSTSGGITLNAADTAYPDRNVIVHNIGTAPVAIDSDLEAAPTVVYPDSATTARSGVFVTAGSSQVYEIPAGHKYIAAVCASGQTTQLVFQVGKGKEGV